jgi:hypothetical protein
MSAEAGQELNTYIPGETDQNASFLDETFVSRLRTHELQKYKTAQQAKIEIYLKTKNLVIEKLNNFDNWTRTDIGYSKYNIPANSLYIDIECPRSDINTEIFKDITKDLNIKFVWQGYVSNRYVYTFTCPLAE